MKKKMTKIISIILSVLLVISVMPMTVFATGPIASVTNAFGEVTEFATLVDAKNYACANIGSTLTLLTDVEINENDFHIIDCDFTLELNGKTLSSANTVIYIHRGGKLTIKDSVGTGVVTCAAATGTGSSAIVHCGELIVEGGTFIGKDYAVKSCDKIIVKDGTFIGDERGLQVIRTEAVSFVDSCELKVGGRYGEYLNGYGTLLGGTFVGGIYINNYDRWDEVFGPIEIRNLLPEGYGFYDEDGNEVFVDIEDMVVRQTVTVKEGTGERPNVAKVEILNGKTEYFVDFWSAVYYAAKNYNTKLTLLKDFETTGVVYFLNSGPLDIDLNGKTLSSSATQTLYIQGGGPVNVYDSVGGSKIINTYETDKPDFSKHMAVKSTARDTTFEGITIESKSATGLTIYGNTTFNNCKISSEDYYGVYCIEKKSFNFNNTTCYGGIYGVYLRDLSTFNMKGGALSGGERGYYHDDDPIVCLSDCVINGMKRQSNSMGFIYTLAEGYEFYDENGDIFDVRDYIEPNEIPIIHKDIKQTLYVKNRFPVSVIQPDGTTEYFPSVDEGVDAANKDIKSTLKLLKDILLNSSLTFDGITTLDLNGKNVAIDDDYDYTVVVDEGASLDIIDSKDGGTIGGGGVIVNNGSLNFNSGNIDSTMDGILNINGDVTVNGGSIAGGYGAADLFVDGEGVTKVYGGAFEDGFSVWGTTINDTVADGYALYSADGAVEITDDQIEVSDNVVVYEKTIVTAMSSQIRFNRNDDGSYAGSFDIRTRAKISDADFQKYIAASNEEASEKISKVGFVYSKATTEFNIDVAKTVAQGGTAEGFVDKPISYIQDADGYYMFTCFVTGIPEEDLDNGLTAYAYICVDDMWYFFPVEVTAEFSEMYGKYYPVAAEQYGWEL